MSYWKRAITISLAAIIVAFISICGVSKIMTKPETYSTTMQYLDDKKLETAALAGAATSVSFAVSALQGDTGTAISQQLADLGGKLLLIVSVIVLEKYLLTTVGYVAFVWLIPIACALLVIYALFESEGVRKIAVKLIVFSIVLTLVVPFSVKVSVFIEEAYKQSTESTAENLVQDADSIKNGNDDDMGLKERAVGWVNNLIDSVAVLIVTSCVLPILILLLLIWVIKLLFGVEIKLPSMPRKNKRYRDSDDEDDFDFDSKQKSKELQS